MACIILLISGHDRSREECETLVKQMQETPGGLRADGLRLRAHPGPGSHVPGGRGSARAKPGVRPHGLTLAEQVICILFLYLARSSNFLFAASFCGWCSSCWTREWRTWRRTSIFPGRRRCRGRASPLCRQDIHSNMRAALLSDFCHLLPVQLG